MGDQSAGGDLSVQEESDFKLAFPDVEQAKETGHMMDDSDGDERDDDCDMPMDLKIKSDEVKTPENPMIPPHFVPSEKEPPPLFFMAIDGLAIKVENRGTLSRTFGPKLDEARFGPQQLSVGDLVCEVIVNYVGQVIDILEHPRYGTLYRMNWLDKKAGWQIFDDCFYTRTQLRWHTKSKRVIDEKWFVPLPPQEKVKTTNRTSQIPVERTFISGWTEKEMSLFKLRDMVMVNGQICRVIKNDKTNRGLWINETDLYGKHIFPLMDHGRDVNCDACLIYYEDIDKKTPENASRKFSLRDGNSSISTGVETTIDDLLDGAENDRPSSGGSVVITKKYAPRLAHVKTTANADSSTSKSGKAERSVHVTLSPANIAALEQRIRELESENLNLKSQELIMKMADNRNSTMLNHFMELWNVWSTLSQ